MNKETATPIFGGGRPHQGRKVRPALRAYSNAVAGVTMIVTSVSL